ncbi:hypothetical protein BN871_AC_00940 [Paenibacillus sp. P22]|nr:hypothetical protein BN871_AC_00940 [Paenibacillus sp. P22]
MKLQLRPGMPFSRIMAIRASVNSVQPMPTAHTRAVNIRSDLRLRLTCLRSDIPVADMLILILPFLLQQAHDRDHQQRDGQQQEAHHVEGVVPGRIEGHVRHLHDDVARQHGCRLQQAVGQLRRVADDHDDGHRLADGAGHAENARLDDAAARSGQDDAGHGLKAGRSQSVRALNIFAGNGADRIVADAGYGRQDHDGQHQRGRQHPIPEIAPRHGAQRRNEQRKPHVSVDDGWDADEQIQDRTDYPGQSGRSELGKEQCRQNRYRHRDRQRKGGNHEGARDEDERSVLVVLRFPLGGQEKLPQGDALEGQHAGAEHEEEHRQQDAAHEYSRCRAQYAEGAMGKPQTHPATDACRHSAGLLPGGCGNGFAHRKGRSFLAV